MTHEVNIEWAGGVAFESSSAQHKIMIDAPFEAGGEDKGIRPKMLLLASLGGCTGVDVVLILQKMKVSFDSLRIAVEGRLTEKHPKVYDCILLKYYFKGTNLEREKLQRAIELSQEKYCGVTAMLRNSVNITYEIFIEASS